jgi:hypothetical protein
MPRPWLPALLAATAALSPARPAPAQVAGVPSNRVDYRIQVRVDPRARKVVGSEVVRFENRAKVATAELWFHLYWNAFANNRSTHLTESGGRLRNVDVDDGWGWQRVTSLRAGDSDLTAAISYEHPDDDNADDRTVIKVPLPAPVAPGESVEVELAWEAQIPRVRRRTGYKGDFLFFAHWFPALGVFEGERGWNCHQFHASTEFYSDYGTYEVAIDLPAEYERKVFATGVAVGSPTRAGDRVVTRFVAPDPNDQLTLDATGRRPLVHTFTWTADPDFKRFAGTFHFAEWSRRFDAEVERVEQVFGPSKNLRLRNVEVVVVIQPEREAQWRRHFEATCAALFFYGLWFGEYPYSQVTCVDPAWGAGAAGGMEYPTLFTAGTRLWTDPAMHEPESVTVHECGHQFWYGLVGNNEFEAAWLDEGFNSYGDAETLWRVWGREVATTDYSHVPYLGSAPVPAPGSRGLEGILSAQRIPLPFVGWSLTPLRPSGFVDWWRDQPRLTFVENWTDPRWHDRVRYLSDPDRDPIDTPGWKYADSRSYSTNSYPRTAVALRTLAGLVGQDKFLRGMRHYSEAWRYRHPYPQDFFDSFCAGAETDVRWYFEEVFRGTGTLDWQVSVEQRRAAEPAGWFQPDPGAEFGATGKPGPSDGAPDGGASAPDAGAARAERDGGDRPWEAEVLVVRKGELRLPLEIELRFDDASRERRTWTREEQASSRWLEIRQRGDKKLVGVVLDPDRHCYLDRDLSNNAWFDEACEVAPWRWAERAFQRYLQLLHWQAGIGG